MSKESKRDLFDWNQAADVFSQAVGNSDDRIYQQLQPVLWDALGNVSEMNVLDLGCGHGWLSGELLAAGAYVTGIDGSAALLDKARKAHPKISFLQHDLSTGLPDFEITFDRVIAHMVLMDIPVLDALTHDIKQVLKPDGRFIFTMPHPCFFNQKMRLDENGQPFRAVAGYHREEVWRIDGFGGHNHYHRSLTYYFELLRTHGFAVSRLFEPEHIPAEASELESFWRSIPVFILIEAVVKSLRTNNSAIS